MAIKARRLAKVYGEGETAVRALAGVDLDVGRGEMVAIMGPSGAGKSTLLRSDQCLLGIVVGAVLGWALLEGLSAGIPGVQYRPPLTTMAWVALAGVVLGLIASIVPARRAARLDVIRALSYE